MGTRCWSGLVRRAAAPVAMESADTSEEYGTLALRVE